MTGRGGGGGGGFPGMMHQGEHKLLVRREKSLDMFNEKGYFHSF